MSDGDAANFTVVFRSAAIEPGDVFVRSLQGREALSQLYEYTLEVETTFGGALDQPTIDLLLAKSAYFAFGDDESHKVHGWVREVETMSTADAARVVYRLRLVPKMFDLTLTFGSWVYQNLDAPGLVKDVLDNAKWTEGEDYEFRLTGAYSKHEYKVQYQETDFNFVSRVMEHEGLFYFFEHGDKGAKLVVTDANTAFRPREGYEHLAYETRQGISGPIEVVSALSRVQRTVPAKVSLRDYNYRTPSVPLLVDSAVDADAGIGEQVYYGEHFKDDAGGRRLARFRAQEHFAQREVYRGTSMARGLRAGDKFTLEGHPLAGYDMDYLVTEVVQSVTQEGQTGEGTGERAYRNDFVAIPYAVPFRAPQVTPRPRIVGVIHGRIDAPADGDRATPLDEMGRYKVILPWDVAGEEGGKASRWIRMAQPASGGGYGVQFPLHMGTEVLLVHIDGDPDRPIISGSAPNPNTASPVTSANATQSMIRTRHGITVTFDDQSG